MHVSFNEIIGKSFGMMFKNKWLYLLGAFAVVPFIIFIFFMFLSIGNNKSEEVNNFQKYNQNQLNLENAGDTSISDKTSFNILYIVTFSLGGILLISIIGLYLTTYSSNALTYSIGFLSENEDLSVSEASLKARKKVLPILGANFISSFFSSIILYFIFNLFSFSDMLTQNDSFVYLGIAGLVLSIFLGLSFSLIFYFSLNHLSYLILFDIKSFSESIIYSYRLAVKYILENLLFTLIQFFFVIISISMAVVVYLISVGILAGAFTLGGDVSTMLFSALKFSSIIYTVPIFLLLALISIAATQSIQLFQSLNSIFFYTYSYLFNKEILKNEK